MGVPANDPRSDITLEVVLNGWIYPLRVPADMTLDQLVAAALSRGNHTGRPASDWEVRDVAGMLLNEYGQRTLKDLNLTGGEDSRLYLNLRAGIGG